MEDDEIKRPTSIALSPALKRLLEAEARLQDRSKSWITAEAIREYLERQAKTRG